MFPTRLAVLLLSGLISAAWFPASAQSVVSTHSGLVYFFDGAVYLGGQPLAQKFGRFPEIPQGGELRTAQGRAEVLLTPGVFLRLAENSSVRLVANSLSDTQVELLDGSAIVEATDGSSPGPVQVLYKTWRVHVPQEGVYRLDSNPACVTVYRGEADVLAEGTQQPVAAQQGQIVPLASVLAPESPAAPANDAFKSWAMSRSQVVASDNATAAGIMDDPDAIDNATAQGSLDSLGSLSYFPLTGIPGIAVTNPYGVSFWSPYQSTLSAVYFPVSNYSYLYPMGWPEPIRSPLGLGRLGLGGSFGSTGLWPIGAGTRPGGSMPIRSPYSPLPIRSPYAPGPVRSPYSPRPAYGSRPMAPALHAPAAHPGVHAGGGRR